MLSKMELTPEDHRILDGFKTVCEGLAEYLGDGYEFVLHSLEDPNHAAIKVINGEHTGRKENAPITQLAINMLQEIKAGGTKDYISYNSVNNDGKPLHSTTIAIRGKWDRIIGLLCINFYLDTPISSIISTLIGEFPKKETRKETYVQDTNELIKNAVADAIMKVDNESAKDTVYRNKRIVQLLEKEGIFYIKDSVKLVASELSISINTVYLHLRNSK